MKNISIIKVLRKVLSLSILTIVILLVTSCDIQKKRYSRGYTTSWTKNYSKQSKSNDNPSKILVDSTNAVSSIVIEKQSGKQKPIILEQESAKIITAEVLINKSEIDPIEISNHLIGSSTESEQPILNPYTKSTIKKKKGIQNLVKKGSTKTNGLALASLILSLLFLLLFIPTILSFIFAIVALIQIMRNPLRYSPSSKGMAIAALLIDSLILAIVLSIIYSVLTAFIILGILLLLIIAIIASNSNKKPIKREEEPKPIEEPKTKKVKKNDKLNQFFIDNRLLLFLIALFSAFLFIPLGL